MSSGSCEKIWCSHPRYVHKAFVFVHMHELMRECQYAHSCRRARVPNKTRLDFHDARTRTHARTTQVCPEQHEWVPVIQGCFPTASNYQVKTMNDSDGLNPGPKSLGL